MVYQELHTTKKSNYNCMKLNPQQIIQTEDGSHSVLHSELHETYHSIHGAIQESEHTFIGAGLRQCKQSSLNILEIGFGTGLNAFLTLVETEKTRQKVFYTAVELTQYPRNLLLHSIILTSSQKIKRIYFTFCIPPRGKNTFH